MTDQEPKPTYNHTREDSPMYPCPVCFRDDQEPKPEWEEEFDKSFGTAGIRQIMVFSPHNDTYVKMFPVDAFKSFIRNAIKEAVEADRKNYPRKTESDFWWYEKGAAEERRRIAEAISDELPYLRNDEGVNELEEGVPYLEVSEVIAIINQKK